MKRTMAPNALPATGAEMTSAEEMKLYLSWMTRTER